MCSDEKIIHFNMKRGTQPESIYEQGLKTSIWSQVGRKWEMRELYNKELHSLHRIYNIVTVIKYGKLK